MRVLKVFALLMAAVLSLVGCGRKSEPQPLLEMLFLDVGQGDSTLLRTEAGDILIDAGTEKSQEELCRRLRALGVERLALLILTHPDEDHIGGADGVLEQFEVDEVWTNGAEESNDSYLRFLNTLQKKNVPCTVARAGSGCSFGDLHVTVLSPVNLDFEGENDDSLVLLLRYGEFGALMMGDASQAVEPSLIETYGEAHLNVDLLGVGHHGSNSSTGADLLAVANPQYAVISCGAGNSYGHPDGRTLARLEHAGAEVRRTDLEGEICFAVYEDGSFGFANDG